MGCFSFTDYIINKNNLIDNVEIIKSKLKVGTKFCAVVKANAYGLGADIVSNIIKDHVDCFAVANLAEGIALRESGIDTKIITLGAINFNHLNLYSENLLSPPVSSVLEMSKLSRDVKKPLQVEFGLNTGMNRIGFSEKSEILSAISVLNKNKNISLFGVFSHLATKENDVSFMYSQKARFDELLTPFKGMNLVRHLSNTNASINHQDFNYDMVRVGFGMYGMSKEFNCLLPVISIVSRIVKLTNIKAGDSVGYDRTFIADKGMKIAVVPIGYFDGVGRLNSNCGKVVVCGKTANIVGRVCMDAMMIDVTGIENVKVGSKVTILGEECKTEVTLDEYAKWCNTSCYEILARFNNSRMNIVVK